MRAPSASAPANAIRRTSPPGSSAKTAVDVGGDGFEQRRGQLAREQIGQHRGIDQPAHERVVGVGGRADVLAGARRLRRGHRGLHLFEIARRAKRLEDLRRVLIVAIGGRLRAGLRGEAASASWLTAGLIALADQLEDARALRDVVIRLGRARLARAQVAAQAQELAPRAGRGARIEARLDLRRADARPRRRGPPTAALRRRSTRLRSFPPAARWSTWRSRRRWRALRRACRGASRGAR